MKEITIQLTEQQEKFLKTFAEKQHAGAEDNASTANPIHIVENKRYDYIPYSEDQIHFFEDLPLCFTSDNDYDRWWDNEVEMILDYYAERGKECPINVKPYQELLDQTYGNTEHEEVVIRSYSDYFNAYDVPLHGIAWKKAYWEKVAFFFIKDEARKYLKYQAHNLNHPRIYTYGAGYANDGDFIPFRNLLLQIGQTLNQEKETIQ